MNGNKYKILIIEDDEHINNLVATLLEANGYQTLSAYSCEDGMMMYASHRPDLVVLDLGLPDQDGMTFLKRLRKDSLTPVIVLSARSDEKDKVEALDMGANDYVTKPFDNKVLVAKINRLLARVNEEDEVEIYELAFDGLVVNKLSRTVRIDNELIDFRPKEFDLLVFLIENHRIALDRDRILDAVWGIDYFGDTRVVDTHIKKIRKKLGTYAKYIHTVFGVGYKFEVI